LISKLATAGLATREALNNLFSPDHPDRESAIARAKANQQDSYQVLKEIRARAKDLRETDFELQIEEEAAKTKLPKEAVLQAILRREVKPKYSRFLRPMSEVKPINNWTNFGHRTIPKTLTTPPGRLMFELKLSGKPY
jgi:hypothetical protein